MKRIKWTSEKLDLVSKYLNKGFNNEEIAEIMNDIDKEGIIYKASTIEAAIKFYDLTLGVPLKALVKSGRKIIWNEFLVEEVQELAHKGMTDNQIAKELSERHEVKIKGSQILNVRTRNNIQKRIIKPIKIEKENKAISYHEKREINDIKIIKKNREKSQKLKKYNLKKGLKYTVKVKENGIKAIRTFRDLEFEYMTDYLLFFRDKNGLMKTFIRNNSLTKTFI